MAQSSKSKAQEQELLAQSSSFELSYLSFELLALNLGFNLGPKPQISMPKAHRSKLKAQNSNLNSLKPKAQSP